MARRVGRGRWSEPVEGWVGGVLMVVVAAWWGLVMPSVLDGSALRLLCSEVVGREGRILVLVGFGDLMGAIVGLVDV